MHRTRNATRPRDDQGLKMRELVRAAGVPKSTILFYLAAGLLFPAAWRLVGTDRQVV